MTLGELKQIVKTIWTIHQVDAAWVIDREMGKRLILMGTLDKEICEAIEKLLSISEFEAYDWVVGKRLFWFKVRDKVK